VCAHDQHWEYQIPEQGILQWTSEELKQRHP
jgi:hypothetical protein